MTVLLSSVANRTRWEMSPYFSTDEHDTCLRRRRRTRRQREGVDEDALSQSSCGAALPSVEVRRREIFLERVHALLARQSLLALHHRQKQHTTRQQRAVDCYINAQAAQTMRYLLLFLGFVMATAAALCLFGLLHVEAIRDSYST
ncbi:hypothetical protein DQ04_24091000 [Trypanosoma grayi]|uniref:hypothetical protein n=1 Tax=Trypanosoma grayi TaxID=71804 RepID=UPI0004F4B0C7|nr:hypothetical protein DQ04_24091000 [Trypanosoma grayi]KEG05283.1 hypothetical protein DQ04_24091000 [Trypanosoma grayi]